MRIALLATTLIALVACGSAPSEPANTGRPIPAPGSAEEKTLIETATAPYSRLSDGNEVLVDVRSNEALTSPSTVDALTLPAQPFPGFILPGVAGATSFGTATPIGFATTAGLGAGTPVNLFNLINTAGVYHNDYGWSIGASRMQICNLAAPTICLSGIPGTSGAVVLTTNSDGNSFFATYQGGMIKSAITGSCIHAATLASGSALSWAACSSGTPFAGIGYNLQMLDDSGAVYPSFLPGRGICTLWNQASTANFFTEMDSAFYEVIGLSAIPGQFVQLVGSNFEFNSHVTPGTCPGSTATSASMAPNANGIGTPCSGTWQYSNTGSGSFLTSGTSADTNITSVYL